MFHDAPMLHDANVGADPAAAARRGIFNDTTFLDPGNEAFAQLSLKLVRRFDDKPRVDVQPMGFKVRVHAGERAFHSHILIAQEQTSKSAGQEFLADGRHRGTGILPVVDLTGWKPVPRACQNL
jgi:hypothetical protein